MMNDLKKTDLYTVNQMDKLFDGGCFLMNIPKQKLRTDRDIYKLLDEICVQEKLFPIGDGWRKVDYELCKKLLHAGFATDLAYGGTRLGKKKVQKLMKIVLEKINPAECYCFTNCIDDPWKEGGRAWNSVTKSTFDIAVVVLDATKVVFTYVTGED